MCVSVCVFIFCILLMHMQCSYRSMIYFFYKIRLSSKNSCSDLNCYKQFHKTPARVTEPRKLILRLSFWLYYTLLNYNTVWGSHTILRIFIPKFKPIPSWEQKLARSTQVMSEQNAIKEQHTDMEMSYELPNGRQLQSLPKYFETLCQWAYNWLKDLPGLF